MWKGLAATFRTEWLQNRAAQRERARGQDGGPNYYIVRRHRLGAALLNFVARNMSEGVLTPTRASKLLGVKPRSVHPLLRSEERRVGKECVSTGRSRWAA